MFQTDNISESFPRNEQYDNDAYKISQNQYEKQMNQARDKMRTNVAKILSKLHDKDEWISLIFLILDENILHLEGFRLINDVQCGNVDRVSSFIIRDLLSYQGPFELAFDPLIEALYFIGRYDIFEDDLGLCIEHHLHVNCRKLTALFRERLALFQVFSGIPQEKANMIVASRLSHWKYNISGELLEVTFIRNLDPSNYVNLITDIYEALCRENLFTLAKYLLPYSRPEANHSECLDSHHDPCNEALTGSLKSDFYPLPKNEPHGLCVIINVKNFMPPKGIDDDIPLHLRLGSDIDKFRLEGTFKLFGFNVIHISDPSYRDINEFFAKIRRDGRLYAISCLAVCVMTHGDVNDNLYLADRTCIAVTDLRKLCYAKALIGKPKLYFVQACRGEESLRPMLLQRDTTVASNSETDCIICAATVRGYSAMRSQSSGSWFITDLCSTLQEIGHLFPLKNVMRETRKKLNERVDKFEGSYITQTSEDKDTLTKLRIKQFVCNKLFLATSGEVQLLRGSEVTFIDGILDLCTIEVLEEIIDILVAQAVDENCHI